MNCAHCGHDNRETAKFCEECGAALDMACPHCGQPGPATAKFCGSCGQGLAAPAQPLPAALEGERRQATIVFSDLSGYTAMSEKLDPEEVEGFMSRIKEGAVRVVEKHGGTVNQFVGDEVVALFGIPTAHEDDPSRAVRAALELHELVRAISPDVEQRLGRPLHMHTGINTGLIVTNLRDRRDGTVGITGDTVNTGARLVALAAEDEILVSPQTLHQLAGLFATEALAPAEMKGKSAPVIPYRVTGEIASPAVTSRPLVGREAERRQFAGALEACLDTGAGQAVYLRGEPGIGKTRLVEAFRAMATERGFACHTGLVLDFGLGAGRDAVRDLLGSLLEIAPGSDETTRRAAAADALAEGLLDPGREVFLNDLLDLSQPDRLRGLYDAMENETRNRGKRDTFSGLVKTFSARRPLLLVFEDVHWADQIALAHLAALAATVAESCALLLMTSRVAGDPLGRGGLGSIGGYPLMTVDLAPLRKKEAFALAEEFLDISSRVAANCVERAAGNPLFLEQLLRGAEETADDAVPGSVQSIVLARMDRLKKADKQALQAASVLGQRFSLEVLRHLIGEPGYHCGVFVDHNLVRPEGEEFLFAHALIQEGVYNSLLKTRRRQLHGRVAEWFEDKDLGLRAEHLQRAEDPAAPRAYLAAARERAAVFRYERASGYVEKGLQAATANADKYDLTLAKGELLHDLGSIAESIAAHRTALELADDDIGRCRAWTGLAAGLRIAGDKSGEAFEALERAQKAAGDNGPALELARIHYLRGNLYFPLGNIDGCMEQHGLALDHARKAGSREYEARALSGLGDAHYLRGCANTAHEYFRRCVTLSREHGFGRIEVENLSMLSITGLYLHRLDLLLEDHLAAMEAVLMANHPRAEMLARIISGELLLYRGEPERAREQFEQALALARSLKASAFESRIISEIGDAAWEEGNPAQALQYAEQALEMARKTGMGFFGPRMLALVACASDDPKTRRRALEEGEAILREGCVSHNYFWFYRSAMELSLRLGDWDEAERYAAALEDYTRQEPLPWSDFLIAQARALAAHGRGGRGKKLTGELERLRGQAERMGWKIALPAIEAALAAG